MAFTSTPTPISMMIARALSTDTGPTHTLRHEAMAEARLRSEAMTIERLAKRADLSLERIARTVVPQDAA